MIANCSQQPGCFLKCQSMAGSLVEQVQSPSDGSSSKHVIIEIGIKAMCKSGKLAKRLGAKLDKARFGYTLKVSQEQRQTKYHELCVITIEW